MIRFLFPNTVWIVRVTIDEQEAVIDRVHIALEDGISYLSQICPKPKAPFMDNNQDAHHVKSDDSFVSRD
jgi:hypothetical protein